MFRFGVEQPQFVASERKCFEELHSVKGASDVAQLISSQQQILQVAREIVQLIAGDGFETIARQVEHVQTHNTIEEIPDLGETHVGHIQLANLPPNVCVKRESRGRERAGERDRESFCATLRADYGANIRPQSISTRPIRPTMRPHDDEMTI